MTKSKNILTKIECCGAKFSHEHHLGALDPANILKKDQKTFFQTQGVPATGGLACVPWFQQHSISNFLGHPVWAGLVNFI